MKNAKGKKSKHSAPVAVAAPPRPHFGYWPYAAGLAIAFFAVLQVYWPAIHGPFLLDDSYLPYMAFNPDPALHTWIHGLRPLLMFTFWLNFLNAGNQDTFGYHLANVLLHFSNGILILLAVRKVLSWAGIEKWRAGVLSVFAAGLFVLHPLQTESVSYIASRSETLSLFWVLGAFVVFLYRSGDAIGVGRAIAILALFGAAVLSKEHTAVLPALLLVTDYYWNPEFSLAGIRRNWRLYVPIVIGGALAGAFVWRVLQGGPTAGFGVKGLAWYQYFFTQCRVIWEYIGMFVLPVGQNLDPDVAISHGILDHGAVVGLIALAGATVLAGIYRRRFPLASYGWFTFLILIAPTSSFVPIADPFAERRLYLPFIGLLFIVADFLSRWKTARTTLIAALGAVLLAESAATYQRNQLWGSSIDLWKDTVDKSPHKYRPRFQLAFAYYQAGDFGDAIDQFQKVADLGNPTFELLVDWGLAYDAAGKLDQALDKLQQAAAIERNAHVYSQIGMVYGKMGKYPEALAALDTAQKLNPEFAMTYYTRGNVYEQQGNKAQAAGEYRRALSLNSQLQVARDALARVSQ
ncbi:MAG TPA: tetratricopeptide repeat protein [Bryobacteraceae bacterium]|nr:tetratricopeptide repeat protein [Bryobacteraceae bacterium]